MLWGRRRTCLVWGLPVVSLQVKRDPLDAEKLGQ
jgi:hypothetical protein